MENRIDISEFRKLIIQSELEILEFKKDNAEPEKIGRYISALANSSAVLGKQCSYMIWGVSDDKKIIGTKFRPKDAKKGGEPLVSWLERSLDPKISINFEELDVEGFHVVVLVINMTAGRPISFLGGEYIRSGSSVRNLREYPEKARDLWRSFDARTFEREFAKTDCTSEEVLELLDTSTYLKMLKYDEIASEDEILSHMEEDRIIEKSGNKYNLTNLGAYSFAKNLAKFEKLKSHAVRVVRYKNNNKLTALSDISAAKGAVVGFEGLLNYIRTNLPLAEEVYEKDGQRIEKTDYPQIVIREIIANLIVHQDFSVKGSNPMVEIYENRVEFSNPGAPINEANRLLDLPPISRNEALANLFRKMHLVESRGSGIDKIVITLELDQLPAPDISARENNTIVTLYERKSLHEMNDRERINAIFYHTARLFMENSFMTNKTVRTRFGLRDNQSALATKAISLAVKTGLIKPYDENAGNKFMQYIPFWADGYNDN